MKYAQERYDKAMIQAAETFSGEEFRLKRVRDEGVSAVDAAYHNCLSNAEENYQKAVAKAKQVREAETIEEAMEDLIDIECPYCHKPLETPSLKDIQNWLEGNGQ